MSHFSRSVWQQRREHMRLACDRHSRGNFIDEQTTLCACATETVAPLSSRFRAAARGPSKVGIRLRGYGVKIGAPPPADFRGEAAFVSRNGAPAPETWDPDGAAIFTPER